ncbi:MAG TPA: hypothetical protein VM409_04645 [Chloroflexia bacterium]|nr:hypothetical protein [Chloroflexia bacterium]
MLPTITRKRIAERAATPGGDLPLRSLLASVTALVLGIVFVPALAPVVMAGPSHLDTSIFSHVARSSAFVSFGLLWVSMLAGLSITGKTARRWPGMSASFGLHRHAALLGLGMAVLHPVALFTSGYMGYTPAQVVIPFVAGAYKPQWIGLGQIGLYAFAMVALSFFVRDRLGVRSWRLVHSLSFALFLMTLLHGMQTGSDSGTWWATSLYWLSGASVVLAAAYRIVAARIGRARTNAAETGLVAVAGRSQKQCIPVLQGSSASFMPARAMHSAHAEVLITE